ncbi:MAG TPA: class I adenylate-forming enzyme family protein [Baekduia sp.]
MARSPHPSPHGNFGHAVLTLNAWRTPDAVAVDHRGTRHTYAAMNARVNQIAHGLLALGLQPGEPVACLFTSGLDIAEFYLAMAKTGVISAALNPFWDAEQIEATAAASAPAAVVYDPAQAATVAAFRERLPGVRHWIVSAGDGDGDGDASVITRDQLVDGMSTDEPPLGAFDDDPMSIYYSSGTTGLAKGIVHSHRSNLANAGDIWLDLPHAADSIAASSTMLWGAGFPATLGSALFAGIKTVLQEDMGPARFLEVVPAERITHAITRPSFWTQLFDQPGQEDVDLSSLRCVLLGSEPILPSVMERIVKRLPDCTMWSYFGTTEAPFSCFGRADTGEQPLNACGRARATVAVEVVNASDARLVDETGEIRIAGPHLMSGYLGLDEATDRVLSDGWFYTGDLGVQDARGVLTVRGRADEAILRDTQWVLPAEVEEALASVDGVREAGVVGVDDNDRVEILAAVKADRDDLDVDALRAAVRDQLGEHAAPKHIILVDELPHAEEAAGPGKLLRRVIRDQWWPLQKAGV